MKAIFFDMDGTLIDSIPAHIKSFKQAYMEALAGKAPDIDDSTARYLLMKPITTILLELEEKHGIKIEQNSFGELRRKHLFELTQGKELLFPGTEQTIKKLKEKFRVAIVTSAARVSTDRLISREFESIFETTVTFGDVSRHKPFPEPFLLAAQRMKIEPKNCFTVGDSLFDLRAAKAAGMKPVSVPTGLSTEAELIAENPWKLIHSLKELEKLLL